MTIQTVRQTGSYQNWGRVGVMTAFQESMLPWVRQCVAKVVPERTASISDTRIVLRVCITLSPENEIREPTVHCVCDGFHPCITSSRLRPRQLLREHGKNKAGRSQIQRRPSPAKTAGSPADTAQSPRRSHDKQQERPLPVGTSVCLHACMWWCVM
jgi:hypothetical protein